MAFVIALTAALLSDAPTLPVGDSARFLMQGDRKRSYLLHVPPSYDAKQRTPVVLALHGAGMNSGMMAHFCQLNKKSDAVGFLVVYPNGTGVGPLQTWNAGGWPKDMAASKPDDVCFIRSALDDLASVANVDKKRVYATGLSNGGMMAYRLAAELSDRIAAIAPVAGTMTLKEITPLRAVPVLHLHGTDDKMVPYHRPADRSPRFIWLQSVEDSASAWAKFNGCVGPVKVEDLPRRIDDGTKVIRKHFGVGRDQAEVIVYAIAGGGHTWPGVEPPVGFLGKSTQNISANDVIWEFFEKHPMK